MKKIFTTLILIFGILVTAFTQSQELNTIIENLIRPNNVDSYFEHQSIHYQDYYEGLKAQVEEMIDEEQSIKKRIQGKKKIKRKDQIVLDETYERLELLKEDLSFIKEFMSLWKNYENFDGKIRKDFQVNYDASKCYLIKTEEEELKPYEYEIGVEELTQEIQWKELVEGIESYRKGERILINADSTKWIKRKDIHCRSTDPNDCIIWCQVVVPPEYGIAEESGVLKCPIDFQISADKKYCYRTVSIINEKGKTKRLVIKDKDFPEREISIKEYSVIDCKN